MIKKLLFLIVAILNINCKAEHTFTNYGVLVSKPIHLMVKVGNHELNFNIWQGNNAVPILFEAGGGDDASVWNSIIEPIHQLTGATIITYSRAGFGESSIDSTITDISRHGIVSEIKDLELALKKIGHEKGIMLVSHSYGGYYTTLYSNRHPRLVKSIVLIDVNHRFIENFIDELWKGWEPGLNQFKENSNVGMYYMSANIRETSKLLNKISIPKEIPVVDIVSGVTHLETTEQREFWRRDHNQFIEKNSSREGIIASGTQHHVWRDNPYLVITVIAKSYADILKPNEKALVNEKILNYSIKKLNDLNKTNKNSSK